MTEYTNEQLLEMYHKLPKDVQEAILSVDTSEAIREIGEKHKLMIDKMGDLADETGLVMLGIIHPGQYVSHLIERLGINQETAQEIAEEVNNRILFPIRDSLRKIQKEREELTETIPEESPPTPRVETPPMPEAPTFGEVGEKPVPETPFPASSAGRPAFETATLVPPSLILPETLTPPISPVAPPIPQNLPIGEEPAIFQAKTKEEIFRLPLRTVEKTPESKKIDPYKEPIS